MLGHNLSHSLKRGKLSFLGKPLFSGLIKLELAYIRFKDGKQVFQSTERVDKQLTAIIKTFERPDALKRLIASIKRFYPGMRVIVVDDSREPVLLNGVENLTLPYDSGVSAGRQMALDKVATPYVLLLDDDFVFYRETELEPAMKLMFSNESIDIMGGVVVNLPSFKSANYSTAALHPTKRVALQAAGTRIAGLPVFDKVPNFYIARTERLRLVGWDKRIKRLDHAEFFTRAKGILLTVFNKDFKVLHAQKPFNRAYMQKRNDIEADREYILGKYYSNGS